MHHIIAREVERWRGYDYTTEEIVGGLHQPRFRIQFKAEGCTEEDIAQAIEELGSNPG